mmetsp:Transcript_10567/g.27596  ORF Transcript_10567/g.27596 Transcript_10567/m.27596 type:complete len:96 (-) Transcript_10567:1848-2135(-)
MHVLSVLSQQRSCCKIAINNSVNTDRSLLGHPLKTWLGTNLGCIFDLGCRRLRRVSMALPGNTGGCAAAGAAAEVAEAWTSLEGRLAAPAAGCPL